MDSAPMGEPLTEPMAQPESLPEAEAANGGGADVPPADAPANAVHDDPHTIKAFKALPEVDEQGEDTIMNARLQMPGLTGNTQHLKSAHWR